MLYYLRRRYLLVVSLLGLSCVVHGWIPITVIGPPDATPARPPQCYCSSSSSSCSSTALHNSRSTAAATTTTSSWFTNASIKDKKTLEQRKAILLQLGASLDRGQAYNPTSGEYYKDRMDAAVQAINGFLEASNGSNVPTSLQQLAGEWELVLSTVPHGIFRSSPFFLAIQEAYETYADEKESFGMKKADLFFKLHELQTCSWGVSKIGRVAQHITTVDDNTDNKGWLYSEFDTSIFSLTVIPILGWFKLLPTFGGCVVTAAQCSLVDDKDGTLEMKVDYTTARKVPGLTGLGEWIWSIKVPVGAIWKLLPWNQGRDADCRVYIKYVDDDFRIVQDVSGDYFVYTRPVVPRALDLAEADNDGGANDDDNKK